LLIRDYIEKQQTCHKSEKEKLLTQIHQNAISNTGIKIGQVPGSEVSSQIELLMSAKLL
jgi:hypothetical protein